jgi:hypothetical protein
MKNEKHYYSILFILRKLPSPFWSRSVIPKIDQIFQTALNDGDSDNEATDDNPDGFLFGAASNQGNLPILQSNISLPKGDTSK